MFRTVDFLSLGQYKLMLENKFCPTYIIPLNWMPLCYIAAQMGIRLLVFGQRLVVCGQRHMVFGQRVVVFGRRLVVCGHHLIRPDCGFQLIHFHPLSPYQEFRKDFPQKLGEK